MVVVISMVMFMIVDIEISEISTKCEVDAAEKKVPYYLLVKNVTRQVKTLKLVANCKAALDGKNEEPTFTTGWGLRTDHKEHFGSGQTTQMEQVRREQPNKQSVPRVKPSHNNDTAVPRVGKVSQSPTATILHTTLQRVNNRKVAATKRQRDQHIVTSNINIPAHHRRWAHDRESKPEKLHKHKASHAVHHD